MYFTINLTNVGLTNLIYLLAPLFDKNDNLQVRREAPKSWKKCLAKASARDDDESWELKPETAFVKNDADMTVVEPHQLIESYRYGSELIAVQGWCPSNITELS